MTDEELFNAALGNLLGDLFTGILYSNKVRQGARGENEIGQKELLEAAAGTLWFFMNDAGRQVLRGVLDKLNDTEDIASRGLVN